MNNVIKEEKKIRIQFLFELMKEEEEDSAKWDEKKCEREIIVFFRIAHTVRRLWSLSLTEYMVSLKHMNGVA